jgi:hypothetical protein
MVIKDIKDWIKATYISREEYITDNDEHIYKSLYDYVNRDRIVCIDGFSFSVQGNTGMYSEPREYTDEYLTMEIGFPSEPQPELIGDDNITGYVEVEIIQKIIDRHGGIDVEKSGILKLNNKNSSIYKREEKLKRILND